MTTLLQLAAAAVVRFNVTGIQRLPRTMQTAGGDSVPAAYDAMVGNHVVGGFTFGAGISSDEYDFTVLLDAGDYTTAADVGATPVKVRNMLGQIVASPSSWIVL